MFESTGLRKALLLIMKLSSSWLLSFYYLTSDKLTKFNIAKLTDRIKAAEFILQKRITFASRKR